MKRCREGVGWGHRYSEGTVGGFWFGVIQKGGCIIRRLVNEKVSRGVGWGHRHSEGTVWRCWFGVIQKGGCIIRRLG